jgi:outer membrane protein TolC
MMNARKALRHAIYDTALCTGIATAISVFACPGQLTADNRFTVQPMASSLADSPLPADESPVSLADRRAMFAGLSEGVIGNAPRSQAGGPMPPSTAASQFPADDSQISLADRRAMFAGLSEGLIGNVPKPGSGGTIDSGGVNRHAIRQQSMVVQSDPASLPSDKVDTQQFDVSQIIDSLNSDATLSTDEIRDLDAPWWRSHAERPMDPQRQAVPAGVNDLIRMTLENSAQVQVYQKTPQIRETAVTQAAASFDWTQFMDATWNDINEPVGSSLTVGGNGDRFNDHNFIFNGGARRKLTGGGTFEAFQRLGHQNTNSQFFIPNDQGTARLVLGYTQPLMRGRGETYNTSLILLARIDVGRARDEYQRQLQQHLLEVARGYWSLYLERAKLAQKISLYLKTQVNVDHLTERQAIDAQRTQLIQATAALEARKSDLIRAKAAVNNAETRLRALINASYLTDKSEILPVDHPVLHHVKPSLYDEFTVAMQNRPEIRGALKEIRAACVRYNMAQHEMLPVLNLVTNTYVAGLQGDSRVGDAWLDQFRDGAPSYSAGLEWELPVGRRAASANVRRRQLERIQLGERYRATLELIRAEVEVAVREVNTSYRELSAKNRARRAAEAEAETLEVRWKSLGGRDVSSGLALEGLLQAQERVALAEEELAQAQLTYSLSLINLRHANGTLLQMDHATDLVVSQQQGVNTNVLGDAPAISTVPSLTAVMDVKNSNDPQTHH